MKRILFALVLLVPSLALADTLTVYTFNEAGEFKGAYNAPASPKEKGVYQEPGLSTRIAPPELDEHEQAVWDGSRWSVVPDFRWSKVYSKQDGSPVEIEELGVIPEGYTPTPKPGEFHEWDSDKNTWEENQAAKDEAAAEIARKSEIRQDEATANLREKIEGASLDQIRTYVSNTFPNLNVEQRNVILGLILLSVK